MSFIKKLSEPRIWRRIFLDRLAEPLHLNVVSLFVKVFGNFRHKIQFDLVLRHHNAYSIIKAADQAKALGHSQISIVEFGVAAGAGLMNMCLIAQKVTKITGVDIKVFGFDTGTGMPPALDYRDHPELYQEGDFPMDMAKLKSKLPANGGLILGNLSETVPEFLLNHVNADCPIGYVVVDVDYYSSTVDALELFNGKPESYLPITVIYLDDVAFDEHNKYAGERLAVEEFNEKNQFRKICRPEFLQENRVFRRPSWLKHIFYLHVMDHSTRFVTHTNRTQSILSNPYL